MSTKLLVKRQNHRLHPCPTPRKNALLAHLITRYNNKSVLILTKGNTEAIALPETKNITCLSDEQLSQSGDRTYDILISFDLPEKALVYLARLGKATEYALILSDAEDEKMLYGIETLLGRTIIQEVIEGFEPDFGLTAEKKQKAEKEAKKELYRIQNEAKKTKSSGDKATNTRDKKSSKPKFIGKDENGKAIFEGKSRERNHYHDGTPRTEEEKRNRSKFGSKPKFFKDSDNSGEEKPKPKKEYRSEEKKPFGKKPFDKAKRPSDKKPFDKDKKPFDKDKKSSDKKPLPKKSEGEARKPKPETAPKRPPKRINVKSLKPKPKEQE